MDSLREEILQNLNENLTEHEVITETVILLRQAQEPGDTVKTVRVTDRTRTRESGSRFNVQGSRVKVVRDTIIVQRTDTIEVSRSKFQVSGDSLNPQPSSLNLTLKWIFWIIIGLIGLTITVKVCSRKR